MKIHGKSTRARKGFSLAEVLAVVGILSVLTLVAVPSILYYQRTLKYTELDDNARAIFVAAQNHLTALRSASAEELEVSAAVGRPALKVPEGAVSGLESGTELMYVSTDVAGADPSWLVLPGAVETELTSDANSYLVEFDPVSGAVYGVFFIEKNGSRTLDKAAYQKLCDYTDGGNSCRVKKGRQAFARSEGGFPVGYYGADGALDITRPDTATLPTPTVTLINAEELRLEIQTDAATWSSSVDQSKVFLSVSVSDGTTAKTLVSKGSFQSGSSATVVLDTLNASAYHRGETQNTAGWTVGGSFADWNTGIAPGADITVTASTWYQPEAGEGVVALPKTVSVSTNSLFAARSEETVNIAYGRHLQNLDQETSQVDSSVTKAQQVKEIDFAKTAEDAGGTAYSWAATYPGRQFSSLLNANLESYDGGSLPIRNLDATRMPNGGLFSNVNKGQLVNIVLVDATVTGFGTAGALAGVVEPTDGGPKITVDNCQVYLTGDVTTTPRVKAAWAGGLFGTARNVTIRNSFAATVVGQDSSSNVGGLVGRASNVEISNSYAACHLTGGIVGGMVGIENSYDSTITIEDSYAAGTVAKATKAAGGMLGSYADNATRPSYPVTIRRSYAAVDYVTVPADAVYGLIPPTGSCANAFYLVKPGVNENGEGTPVNDMEQMRSLTLGSAFTAGGRTGVRATPYNLPNTAEGKRDPQLYAPYPYPTLTMGGVDLPHYGDWFSTSDAVFLTYYERYADGSYGFSYQQGVEGVGGFTTISTLRGDVGSLLYQDGTAVPASHYDAVAEEGYGVLSPGEPSLTVAGAPVELTESSAEHLEIDGKEYSLFTVSSAWLQGHHGYQQASLGGQSIWFNPDFAKTVTMAETSTAAADRYAIRSARQLANLSVLNDYIPKSFTQELNIDASSYSRFPIQFNGLTPNGQSYTGAFQGTFTGGMDKGLSIRNLSIYSTNTGGLFAVVDGGSVRDVKLENCKLEGTANFAGALVGQLLSGSVSNSGVCAVNADGDSRNAPYDDYVISAKGNAGGLIGNVQGGVVSKCFAAVKVNGSTAGGLIGALWGGAVSDSYVGGHMVNGVFEPYGVGQGTNITGVSEVGGSTAGGFVGSVEKNAAVSSPIAITGTCYTTASVGATANAGAFAGRLKDVALTLDQSYARNDVYENGYLVPTPSDIAALSLGSSKAAGDKAAAHPYDATVLTGEYDYKPVAGLDHYGDWPEINMLHGIVAYYEQFESGSEIKTEFSYYQKGVVDSSGKLQALGTLDLSRTGALYSDGYAFLSLNQLHETGKEQSPVILKVAIGTGAELQEYPTTYLGSYGDDLRPFADDPDNPYDRPTYYAYGLPNAALDVAADPDKYFLQLRVAGLESDVELSSLWLNPHFGLTAYNGYGETNPYDSSPKVPIPDATGDVIPIRSVRQLNNMRKYPSDIRSWTQELEIDATRYKGHVVQDAEGYLTVGGLRVTTLQDGKWQPTKSSVLPSAYRLAMPAISMRNGTDTFGGAYDGRGHTISGLSIEKFVSGSEQYAALFYKLSGKATLKNIRLVQCDVTGVSGADKNYVAGLVGWTEGTIQNCTVQEVTITAPQEGGKTGGYVGGMVGYGRKGSVTGEQNAPCEVIDCAIDGGAATYTGGFIGASDEVTIQYAGVRVDGARYDVNTVTGQENVGGFAGGVGIKPDRTEGPIQYSYAAVKVSGAVAGGFAGKLIAGTVENCYAGGHTKGGEYVSNDPNVAGTQNAGGFAGMWNGTALKGLCYTTCSVACINQVDVFADLESGKSAAAPAGFYAGGDVLKGGVVQNVGGCNKTGVAVRTLGVETTRATAHPYDATLSQSYPHRAIAYPDGALMPHYGDWYSKRSTLSREWVQQLPASKPKTFENFEVSASWEGDTLHVNFDVFHDAASGQDIANTGIFTNGVYSISTDLGYRLLFRVERDGAGGYAIKGLDGFTWSSKRVALDGTDYDAKPAGEQDGNYHDTLDITIPPELIPYHVRYIYIGALEDDYVLSIEHDHSTPSSSDKYVEALPIDSTITVDGNFDDWLGYEHQIMELKPGVEGTPLYGHTTSAILGYENKVYLHIINEDKTDIWSGSTLVGQPMFDFSISAKGDGVEVNNYDYLIEMRNSLYPDPVPGTGEYVSGVEKWIQDPVTYEWRTTRYDILRIALNVMEDRQEYEMEIDLDALAQYADRENGDAFTDVTVKFSWLEEPLEVKRDPKN